MIKLYTTPGCETCAEVIKVLQEAEIEYSVIDVSADLPDEELDVMLEYDIEDYPTILYLSETSGKAIVQTSDFTLESIRRNYSAYSVIK